jgi:SAM-dependent methyltransferase
MAPETPDGFVGPSLGFGSPLHYAAPRAGETVVDLGSGAGGDVLRAAQQVGPTGRAIGVDMTPEMIGKARDNARRLGVINAEFRLSEIEHLPLADASADVAISNCVINLIPDKAAAFREAFRVLRPGGRLVVSDMVAAGSLPASVRVDPAAWAACIAGASDADEYLALIWAAGFVDIETVTSTPTVPGRVFSTTLRAVKPRT